MSSLLACSVKPSLRPHPLHAGLRPPCGGALIIVFLRLLCWLVTYPVTSNGKTASNAMYASAGYWLLVTKGIYGHIYILMYIDALLLCYNNIIIHKSTFN